ncbi:hypothetical protein C8Q76DRAFT_688604 [Earliella scabrosa]|nr:hypothetical protein C8Q76DRAFT_688604 [Earliella scabrosa]
MPLQNPQSTSTSSVRMEASAVARVPPIAVCQSRIQLVGTGCTRSGASTMPLTVMYALGSTGSVQAQVDMLSLLLDRKGEAASSEHAEAAVALHDTTTRMLESYVSIGAPQARRPVSDDDNNGHVGNNLVLVYVCDNEPAPTSDAYIARERGLLLPSHSRLMDCVACGTDLVEPTARPILLSCGGGDYRNKTVSRGGRQDMSFHPTAERPEPVPGRRQPICGESHLDRALHQLRRFTEESITPTVLEHLSSCNLSHRRLIAQKMDSYFTTRARAAHLQQEASILTQQLATQRELVKDAKKQMSRATAALNRSRRLHSKEQNELRREITKADQRIQRQRRRYHLAIGLPRFHGGRLPQEPVDRSLMSNSHRPVNTAPVASGGLIVRRFNSYRTSGAVIDTDHMHMRPPMPIADALRLFTSAVFLYAMAVCPADSKLQTSTCMALWSYMEVVLKPTARLPSDQSSNPSSHLYEMILDRGLLLTIIYPNVDICANEVGGRWLVLQEPSLPRVRVSYICGDAARRGITLGVRSCSAVTNAVCYSFVRHKEGVYEVPDSQQGRIYAHVAVAVAGAWRGGAIVADSWRWMIDTELSKFCGGACWQMDTMPFKFRGWASVTLTTFRQDSNLAYLDAQFGFWSNDFEPEVRATVMGMVNSPAKSLPLVRVEMIMRPTNMGKPRQGDSRYKSSS